MNSTSGDLGSAVVLPVVLSTFFPLYLFRIFVNFLFLCCPNSPAQGNMPFKMVSHPFELVELTVGATRIQVRCPAGEDLIACTLIHQTTWVGPDIIGPILHSQLPSWQGAVAKTWPLRFSWPVQELRVLVTRFDGAVQYIYRQISTT
jgi:hypothetical protein